MKSPEWKPRNTARAQTLRREATPAERELWRHLARSQLGAKFSRRMPVGQFFADFSCRVLKVESWIVETKLMRLARSLIHVLQTLAGLLLLRVLQKT